MNNIFHNIENIGKESELKARNTNGKKQFRIYFEDFIDSEYFENSKMALRKKYGIPLKGFTLHIKNKRIFDKYGLFYIPQEYSGSAEVVFFKMPNDIKMILNKKIPIDDVFLMLYLKLLIFHKEVPKRILNGLEKKINWPDLCKLVNIKNELGAYGATGKKLSQEYINHILRESGTYPLSIRFNPAIGQRQLIDFIVKNWQTITLLEHEEGFNAVLKGKKTRTTLNSDRIIIKNIDKPTKSIISALKRAGLSNITEWQINKRKGLIRKRRKQV